MEDKKIVLRIQNLIDFVHFKLNSDNTVYNLKRCFDIQNRMFHLQRTLSSKAKSSPPVLIIREQRSFGQS